MSNNSADMIIASISVAHSEQEYKGVFAWQDQQVVFSLSLIMPWEEIVATGPEAFMDAYNTFSLRLVRDNQEIDWNDEIKYIGMCVLMYTLVKQLRKGQDQYKKHPRISKITLMPQLGLAQIKSKRLDGIAVEIPLSSDLPAGARDMLKEIFGITAGQT